MNPPACPKRVCCAVILAICLGLTATPRVSAQPQDGLTPVAVQMEPFPLYRYELSNGLRLWFQPRPDSTSVTLLLTVAAGALNETPADNGISHFTEHMLFAGSQRWNEQEIKEVITNLGGRWNGYTSYSNAGYYAQVEPQHFATALDWLVEIVTRPAFSEATLAKEREVIRSEGWGSESRVLEWLYAQGFGYDMDGALLRKLYPDSPLSLSILGTRDSLDAIDVAAVEAYHARYYRPDNMIMVVVGNVTQTEVEALAQRYLDTIPATGAAPAAMPAIQPAVEKAVHAVVRGPFPTDQVRIARGFTTSGQSAPDFWAREVLAEYLAQRLERQIRQERGLVYGIWADNVVYDDVGYLAIRTHSEHRHRDEIIERIDDELDTLAAGNVNSDDFLLAQNARAGLQALSMEDNMARAGYVAGWAARLSDDAAVPDFRTALAAVTPADLAQVAASYAAPERRFLAEHVPIVTGAHLAWLAGGLVLAGGAGLIAVVWRKRRRMTNDE